MNQKTNSPAANAGQEPISFETALARIETIVHDLEEGQIGLAESLARYEEGVTLLRQSYALLEKAERRIEQLIGVDAAGAPLTEPFDDTATAEREPPGAPRKRRATRSAKPPADEPDPPDSPSLNPPDVDVPRSLF